MEKPNKRDREEDDEDRRPGKRPADEVPDPEEPPRRWAPTRIPRSQRPDLSYLGAGAEARQAAPLTEPERGADGEYTRARAIGALAHRRDCERCGFQDFDAELLHIDELQARIEENRRAWRCTFCKGLRADLQVQKELRADEQKETRRALAYVRAYCAQIKALTADLVASMGEAEQLRREVRTLRARLGYNNSG
jgi:hypothetical protein